MRELRDERLAISSGRYSRLGQFLILTYQRSGERLNIPIRRYSKPLQSTINKYISLKIVGDEEEEWGDKEKEVNGNGDMKKVIELLSSALWSAVKVWNLFS